MAWQFIGMSTSILAVPRHQLLGAKYAQIRSYTAAREEFVNQHASYFSIARCVGVDPVHVSCLPDHAITYNFLSTGLYLSSMPAPPTKPPLVGAGALYVDQLHLDYRLFSFDFCEPFSYDRQSSPQLSGMTWFGNNLSRPAKGNPLRDMANEDECWTDGKSQHPGLIIKEAKGSWATGRGAIPSHIAIRT